VPDNKDRYDFAYADKLWNLLPENYRAQDANQDGAYGPLREMVNRIGAQAAVVRRSIDRLWEDQSIESCDDWLIPYIADLLATKLVSSLDARGQRVDVAKTIYYRQRKGTVAILEEIGHDITGWDVKVVEFFRRLSRTRHDFDPPIGLPAETDDPAGNFALQIAEGLIGASTRTAIGGAANLRNVYGSSRAQTAFDEFFHTADFRRGQDTIGWQNIPHLGVFLWQLYSYGVPETAPVAVAACPGQFTVDPTGRDISLFAASVSRAYGDQWASPAEWQLPTPIDLPLLQTYLTQLYAAIDPIDGISVLPNALGIYTAPGVLLTVDQVSATPSETQTGYFIDPTRGRLIKRAKAPGGAPLVRYHYGFSSTIGAGPYDRRTLGESPIEFPGAPTPVAGGASALTAPLTTVAPTGVITINDSLTYTSVADVGGTSASACIAQVALQSANGQRPVIRMSPPSGSSASAPVWTFNGLPGAAGASTAQLVLDGLLITGGEIALTGQFDTVLVRCSTLDPGQWNGTTGHYDLAVDGAPLIPCRLRVTDKASVRQLIIDRSIVGPILTEGTGNIEQLLAVDSIIQGAGPSAPTPYYAICTGSGTVTLTRTTVLGPLSVHRLNASECILDDVAAVQDTQDGCIRFCAWAKGSALPRRYESVEVAAVAPLFTSRRFGDPGYAQLLENVDAEIIPPSPPLPTAAAPPTISAGAQNGSEMGAFARELRPIKENSIIIKYQEYMPLGLTPTLIRVASASGLSRLQTA
jgi:hypothetical protein